MEHLLPYFSDFSPLQLKQLAALKELYAEWNSRINVISRKDMDNFYVHHVLHSLSVATVFDLVPGMSIMDLGCGGGFPGIPLAIFFPETNFHMVDSINKKLTVVKEIAGAIGLHNISIQHTRAEDIGSRKFDAVISRAVAPLKDLWHWSKPLLQKSKFQETNMIIPNGLICLKGGDLAKEISESGCKPMVWEIEKMFRAAYFKDKLLLYIPFKK